MKNIDNLHVTIWSKAKLTLSSSKQDIVINRVCGCFDKQKLVNKNSQTDKETKQTDRHAYNRTDEHKTVLLVHIGVNVMYINK